LLASDHSVKDFYDADHKSTVQESFLFQLKIALVLLLANGRFSSPFLQHHVGELQFQSYKVASGEKARQTQEMQTWQTMATNSLDELRKSACRVCRVLNRGRRGISCVRLAFSPQATYMAIIESYEVSDSTKGFPFHA
jgi:hypothetical protein